MTNEITDNMDAFELTLQNTSKFVSGLEAIETETEFTNSNALLMLVWHKKNVMHRINIPTKKDKQGSNSKCFYARVTKSFDVLSDVYATIGFKKLVIVLRTEPQSPRKTFEYKDVKPGWVGINPIPSHPFWVCEIFFELPDPEGMTPDFFCGGYKALGSTLKLKVITLDFDSRKELYENQLNSCPL